jgi:hypothetical protein
LVRLDAQTEVTGAHVDFQEVEVREIRGQSTDLVGLALLVFGISRAVETDDLLYIPISDQTIKDI